MGKLFNEKSEKNFFFQLNLIAIGINNLERKKLGSDARTIFNDILIDKFDV